MKKIIFALLLTATSASAQTANEIEGAYIGCEGIRRACSRTPAPTDCTKTRIDNCKIVEDAWNKLQADRLIENRSKSIDGIAEQLKQKAKP